MNVGDTVFADFGMYSAIDVREGFVERITPTGQAVINFNGQTYKFRDGRQITSDPWHKARILDKKQADELLAVQNDRTARRRIRAALENVDARAPKSEILDKLSAILKMVDGLSE